MNEIAINLDPASHIPLYEQIYEYFKNEIKRGNLPCGFKLPSTRALAGFVDVSRSTTQMAYDQLLSEGYIESVPCRGYYVCRLDGICDVNDADTPEYAAPIHISYPADKSAAYAYDFSPRGVALDNFPFNAWRRITKNILTDNNRELFNNGLPEGEAELRRTICEYLHRSRGVNCSPEQIIIGAGNEYLLMLIHQLIDKKSIFAMENPTYGQAYKTLRNIGRRLMPIPMDKDGISTDALRKSHADVAYVMPSHQFPMGIVMPQKRRQELLRWAEEAPGRYIIEDDYDSEFRYKGKPIPSLQGSAGPSDRVIYLGTFSKAIAPAIRMSYVVLPADLLRSYHGSYHFLSNTVSRIDQMIVNSFIQEGYYERHLNKLRALYKTRHDTLLNELKPFENDFKISGEYSGIHVLLTAADDSVSEAYLEKAALNKGVKVYPVSSYCMNESDNPPYHNATILIGYANISADDITDGIRTLLRAWQLPHR